MLFEDTPLPELILQPERAAPISVLLAGPSDAASLGLRGLLQTHRRFAFLAATSSGIERGVERLRPDLVVLDPRSRDRLDTALVARLANIAPETHICLYTSLFEPRAMLDALLASLILVGHGGLAISPVVVASLREQGAASLLRLIPPGGPILTERQHDVLQRLAAGKSREQIADQLGFSERTVRREIEQLKATLKTPDLDLLLMQAALYGLLDDGPST